MQVSNAFFTNIKLVVHYVICILFQARSTPSQTPTWKREFSLNATLMSSWNEECGLVVLSFIIKVHDLEEECLDCDHAVGIYLRLRLSLANNEL